MKKSKQKQKMFTEQIEIPKHEIDNFILHNKEFIFNSLKNTIQFFDYLEFGKSPSEVFLAAWDVFKKHLSSETFKYFNLLSQNNLLPQEDIPQFFNKLITESDDKCVKFWLVELICKGVPSLPIFVDMLCELKPNLEYDVRDFHFKSPASIGDGYIVMEDTKTFQLLREKLPNYGVTLVFNTAKLGLPVNMLNGIISKAEEVSWIFIHNKDSIVEYRNKNIGVYDINGEWRLSIPFAEYDYVLRTLPNLISDIKKDWELHSRNICSAWGITKLDVEKISQKLFGKKHNLETLIEYYYHEYNLSEYRGKFPFFEWAANTMRFKYKNLEDMINKLLKRV